MTSPEPPYRREPTHAQHLPQGARQFPRPGPGIQQPGFPSNQQQAGTGAWPPGMPIPNQPWPGSLPPPGQLASSPGAAGPQKRNAAKVVAIVVAVVVVVCCGGAGALALLGNELKSSRQATANNNSVSDPFGSGQPNSGTGPAAPKVAGKVGQAVDGHTFRFTVSTVKCGVIKVGVNNFSKVAKGQYCIVTLTVKNVSHLATTFWRDFASADGSDGVAYRADPDAMDRNDKNHLPFWNNIRPGDSPTGDLVFDIPKNVTLTNFNVLDGLTDRISIAAG